MSKKEFNIKASSLSFWWILLLMPICFIIAGLLAYFVFPKTNMIRFLFIGSVFNVLFLILFYISSFTIRIILEKDRMIVYKNNKLLHEILYSSIEYLVSGDIAHYRNIGRIDFYLKDNKHYHISIKLSTDEKNKLQSEVMRSLIRCFVQKHNFKKEVYYTKYGKALNSFKYINPKYIKDE